MNINALAANALETRVLAMNLSDVRQAIAAAPAQQQAAVQNGGQPADVILELSAAAQALTHHS